MKTRLTFIRHGETDWNIRGIVQGASNVPLNLNGMQQAYQKAPFFKQHSYTAAYSSPLVRARQTLDIILSENKLSLPIQIDDRIVERRFGNIEGKHVNFIKSLVSHGNLPYNYEHNELLEQRLKHFMNDMTFKHPGESLIIVAHSHVLKAAQRSLSSQHEKQPYNTPLHNLGVYVFEYSHSNHTWTTLLQDSNELCSRTNN